MPINQEDLWVSYLFCFLFLFVDFVGITALKESVFPQRRWWLFFSLCHINCMKILTTIIYLFHIKTWNFLYKNPRVFYSIFYRNKHRKQASFWLHNITKTILLFHFSPKPTAEGETKRQQSKQLQFHKITRKKRTYVALLLSDANRTFLPTSLNSSSGANCQICLLFTERYQSQKPESV